MPRRPEFKPTPVSRKGTDTGLWRVSVPDPTRKVGKNRRAATRQHTFSDFRAAEAFAAKCRAEYAAGQAGLGTIDPKHALRFQEISLRAELLGYDSPEHLLDAVEASSLFVSSGPTLRQVLAGYEQYKANDWPDSKTRSTYRSCTRPFAALHARAASSISADEWQAFFVQLRQNSDMATSTFNRAITYLRAAYEHAIESGKLQTNPARNIRRVRADLHRPPVVVTSVQIATFLDHAVRHHPQTVPYWAACFFAGVRPDSEALRLRWEHILLDRQNKGGARGELWISPPTDPRERTKTRRDRYVEIEPALRAWLTPYLREKGWICPVGVRTGRPSRVLLRQSREAIASGKYIADRDPGDPPLIAWGQKNRDLTRHTYATAFAKAHANEPGVNSRLKDNLGHGSEDTADRFYRNPHMTIEEAEAIFAIRPTSEHLEIIAASLRA